MNTLLLAVLAVFTPAAHADDLKGLIQELIQVSAENARVDPALALAIAQQESSFVPGKERPEPKFHTFSVGLFQMFIPKARDMGFKGTKAQLKNPVTNIKLGIEHIRRCTQRFGTNSKLVACCHNAGEFVKVEFCTASAWTSRYVKEVSIKKAMWERILHPQKLAEAL